MDTRALKGHTRYERTEGETLGSMEVCCLAQNGTKGPHYFCQKMLFSFTGQDSFSSLSCDVADSHWLSRGGAEQQHLARIYFCSELAAEMSLQL